MALDKQQKTEENTQSPCPSLIKLDVNLIKLYIDVDLIAVIERKIIALVCIVVQNNALSFLLSIADWLDAPLHFCSSLFLFTSVLSMKPQHRMPGCAS